jgi:hypothetical protein
MNGFVIDFPHRPGIGDENQVSVHVFLIDPCSCLFNIEDFVETLRRPMTGNKKGKESRGVRFPSLIFIMSCSEPL